MILTFRHMYLRFYMLYIGGVAAKDKSTSFSDPHISIDIEFSAIWETRREKPRSKLSATNHLPKLLSTTLSQIVLKAKAIYST